jgi:hypothetical protein
MSWSRLFDDPVPGLRTLRDAANYITRLPKAEQAQPHWQAAAEAVMLVAGESGTDASRADRDAAGVESRETASANRAETR